MKKLLIGWVSLTFCLPAFADWVPYQRNANNEELFIIGITLIRHPISKRWQAECQRDPPDKQFLHQFNFLGLPKSPSFGYRKVVLLGPMPTICTIAPSVPADPS